MAEQQHFDKDFLDDELLVFIRKEFKGLGFEGQGAAPEVNLAYVKGEEFFFQIFEIIIRNVPPGFDEDGFVGQVMELDAGTRVQALIDLIQSNEVLSIDLGYIKGEEIC